MRDLTGQQARQREGGAEAEPLDLLAYIAIGMVVPEEKRTDTQNANSHGGEGQAGEQTGERSTAEADPGRVRNPRAVQGSGRDGVCHRLSLLSHPSLAAARYQIMDVGMVAQIARPGLEHTNQTNLRAEEARVTGQFHQCGS